MASAVAFAVVLVADASFVDAAAVVVLVTRVVLVVGAAPSAAEEAPPLAVAILRRLEGGGTISSIRLDVAGGVWGFLMAAAAEGFGVGAAGAVVDGTDSSAVAMAGVLLVAEVSRRAFGVMEITLRFVGMLLLRC